MEFILIPAGSFWMGSGQYLEDAAPDERPRHQVTISQSFYIGKYEVTQGQWAEIMDFPALTLEEQNLPVKQVSWNDVHEFIYNLNQLAGKSIYRLPTEAEWEYAARAGSESVYSFGEDGNDLGDYAWYDDNSEGQPHPVGQKRPNAWGLYDIHGNVWEWIQDWYDPHYYRKSAAVDPTGPSTGRAKIMRGGGWNNGPFFSRLLKRVHDWPDSRHDFLGFRLVISRPASP
ncbi:MAG: formylglycine-generating enzyme family protein [SAR324 cluster bacterium]|nr:formylglycine-generating enzyme family protein [SAR324 cluster bacterium]